MLYKLTSIGNVFNSIESMPYKTIANYDQLEKDLENLISNNLLDTLFEDGRLLPIFQERTRQPEADIYAINEKGTLIIFELKVDKADDGAVHQVLRYCENASHWRYSKLENMFRKYQGDQELSLREFHKETFQLDKALNEEAFNREQELYVIGNSDSESLRNNVDYWKTQGIRIRFLPYRIYEINGDSYFEFFTPPYDTHSNPADRKGLIFDTNRSYDTEAVSYMISRKRVAAFGDQKHIVTKLNINDFVFLYDKGIGIVVAGKVLSAVKEDLDWNANYCDLEFITPVPDLNNLEGYSASRIRQTLGHNFYWASTIKSPKLSVTESEVLLEALKEFLDKQ